MARPKAGQVTKVGAVKQTIEALGKGADLTEMGKHLKDKYGITMDNQAISTYRSKILKGKKPKKKKTAAAAKVHAPSSNGLSLELLHTVKKLTHSVGAAKLKELIDLFGK